MACKRRVWWRTWFAETGEQLHYPATGALSAVTLEVVEERTIKVTYLPDPDVWRVVIRNGAVRARFDLDADEVKELAERLAVDVLTQHRKPERRELS